MAISVQANDRSSDSTPSLCIHSRTGFSNVLGSSVFILPPSHSRRRGTCVYEFRQHECARMLVCVFWFRRHLSHCSGGCKLPPTSCGYVHNLRLSGTQSFLHIFTYASICVLSSMDSIKTTLHLSSFSSIGTDCHFIGRFFHRHFFTLTSRQISLCLYSKLRHFQQFPRFHVTPHKPPRLLHEGRLCHIL